MRGYSFWNQARRFPSLYYCWWLLYVHQYLFYIFRCSYVGCLYVYKDYILSLGWFIYHYEMSFFVSLKSILSDIRIATRPPPPLCLSPVHPEPAVLYSPSYQWDSRLTDRAALGRAMVARLRLGLLLLVLILPMQIYSNQTITIMPASNPSHSTMTNPSAANATTKASDGALQSTAVSWWSRSLFYISAVKTQGKKSLYFSIF